MASKRNSVVSIVSVQSMIKKLFWGSLLICILSTSAYFAGVISLSQSIEIGVSSIAVLISLVCTRRIYQEHQACYQKELALKQALIEQISDNFPQFHEQDCVIKYIEQNIENQSNAQTRIKTFQRYQQDNKALTHLVESLMQEQDDLKVLEALGLRWDLAPERHSQPSVQRHYYHA